MIVASQVFEFRPNWIDYRHSLVVVDSRRDKGEDPQICADCRCEVDIDPAPHSPRCATLVVSARSRNGNDDTGLDLLERMDAGESLASARLDEEPDDGFEETPSEHVAADDRAAAVAVADAAGVSSSPDPDATKPKRAQGELLIEVTNLLADGPMRLAEIARRCGYSSENLGGWIGYHVKAGHIVKVERGVYALPEESEREPRAAAEGADADTRLAVTDPPGDPGIGEDPSRSENNPGRRRAWDKADITAAIQRWHGEYGHPPTSTEWMRRVDGYPTTTTVAARFGSWANAIEQAGFPRPTRGGVPLKPTSPPAKRVRVRGTGLTYATPEEAYVAADEIEADGERVADHSRFDGDEAKAEQARDQSIALAEKIRDAAHAFEDRAGVSMVEPEDTAAVAPVEIAPFHRAIALSVIAAMRAAADTLEQEIG